MVMTGGVADPWKELDATLVHFDRGDVWELRQMGPPGEIALVQDILPLVRGGLVERASEVLRDVVRRHWAVRDCIASAMEREVDAEYERFVRDHNVYCPEGAPWGRHLRTDYAMLRRQCNDPDQELPYEMRRRARLYATDKWETDERAGA